MATASKKIFAWEGTDRGGNRQRGEMESLSADWVKAELRKQGILPIKVTPKSSGLFGKREKKITTKDITAFARQLATMMKSGVPLVQSFSIVANGHDNPSMQKLINSVKSDVESGGGLADALIKHPKHFDDLFCSLVAAGEQAGALETMLDKLATYMEKTESMKAKVKKAMMYPISVLVIAFVVSAALLVLVIPEFKTLFAGFGADLPAFTLWVIGLSEWAQKWWYAVLIGLGGVFYGFRWANSNVPGFNRGLQVLSLKIPVVGLILNKSAVARFARTLSTMFAAGVPMVEALNSVAGATGNVLYEEAVYKMRDATATGTQLQQSMKASGLFPNMMVQMTAIGEESGSIEQMLGKVADFYEEEVDNLVDGLSSLMEPMIMAVLGVLVGGLVIAMYLPIFQMGSVVGGGGGH